MEKQGQGLRPFIFQLITRNDKRFSPKQPRHPHLCKLLQLFFRSFKQMPAHIVSHTSTFALQCLSSFEKIRKWYSNRKYLTLRFVEESCKCPYAYTGFSIPPTPMPDCVIALKDAIAEITGAVGINSCNANLYQDGSNSISWHSDNEDLFLADRQKSIIVLVSLGADTTFWIRCKANGTETPILLSHGDICTMEGYFQKFFEHCVLPEDNPSYHTSLRINLTFRSIVLHDKACPKRDE